METKLTLFLFTKDYFNPLFVFWGKYAIFLEQILLCCSTYESYRMVGIEVFHQKVPENLKNESVELLHKVHNFLSQKRTVTFS